MKTATVQELLKSLKKDERIPEELKSSVKFNKRFAARYNEFLMIGVEPVVYFDGGKVILSGTRNWFDEKALDEPCQGETVKTRYAFGMEYTKDHREYFCERKYESSAQRHVDQNNCELSYVTELRLFYGDEEQAIISCHKTLPQKMKLHTQPFYDEKVMPSLSLNEIISSALPLYLSLGQHLEEQPNNNLIGSLPGKAINLVGSRNENTPTADYRISYREGLGDDSLGSNIVITNLLGTKEGLLTQALTLYGSTNYEYPDSLDNISDNCCGSYNGLTNQMFVPSGYETIGDCIVATRKYSSDNGRPLK